MGRKVKPKALGSGMARKAGEALKSRQQQLKEQMEKAGAKKKTRKSTGYA